MHANGEKKPKFGTTHCVSIVNKEKNIMNNNDDASWDFVQSAVLLKKMVLLSAYLFYFRCLLHAKSANVKQTKIIIRNYLDCRKSVNFTHKIF